MEKKIITDEIREQLRAPLPAEAISQHPTKPYLSVLKAAYVMERLNDVFGVCGWTVEHTVRDDANDYVVVCGCIYLLNFDLRTPKQYGGHATAGKGTEPADGYKSAVTDLMSKSASYLEIGIDVFKGQNSTAEKRQPVKTKPAAKKSEKAEKDFANLESAAPVTSKFANAGEFLTACAKPPLNKTRSDVLEILSLADISEITDFNTVYQNLLTLTQPGK